MLTQSRYCLDSGLTAQVKRFVDDPYDPLRDQLAPGEQVVAEYDVCKFEDYHVESIMCVWR